MKTVKEGFKVIKILSEHEILINYGFENGAKKGQIARIYVIGEEINDPETGYLLGTLDLIKDDLEIFQTYENFSICKKVIKKKKHVLTPLATNFIVYEKIDVNVLDISPSRIPENSFIKVGDSVKIIA